MSDHLEANVGAAESPLLSADSRGSSGVQEIVIQEPELELTSLTRDVAQHRLQVALSQSHTAIDVVERQDWQSNLVKSQSIEQLHQDGDVQGVASVLETDTENGIHSDHEGIARRRQIFGSNRIEKPPPQVKQIVLETVKDPIIIILLLCAVLSLGFGVIKHGSKGWSDGGGIFAAVFVVVAIIAYCKIWSRRQIFKIAKAGDYFTIDVIRNGETHHISMFDVVVGDVICLKPGDQVPADGLYIRGDSLQVEESNITEEVVSPKRKDSNDPFLFSGSRVTSGSAQMLVTTVGMNAARWQILSKHSHDTNQKTPLEMKLHKLATIIAAVGILVALMVLMISLVYYFLGYMFHNDGSRIFTAGKSRIQYVYLDVIGILTTPLVIASAAVPEGLLLAVIVPIAYSTNRIAAEQKALVRNLSAWEEIASTTVICTNERGIFPSKKLEVSQFWYGQDTFSSIAPNVRELLLQGVVSDNTEASQGSCIESIELAIRKWAFQPLIVDAEAEQMRANYTMLHQKGDPEGMLAKCSQYYDEHGNIKDITNEEREILKQKILEMKSKLPKCIGFSCSDVSEDNKNDNENIHPHEEEKYFTLIGVAGLIYPCPREIKESVNDCQSAGVNIILVTRSELTAARVMAFECGILDPNEDTTTGQVVEGLEFQNHPKEKRSEILDKIRVMARSTTLARRYLVEDLKEKRHVVAITGDSIGDATVLKEANVGLSLGIQRTNIAKENSDIIVLNDSFESIATTMRWGRGMYCKILTYTQFQLTLSISSIVINFVTAFSERQPPNINVVATISAGKAPFDALQVLWVKLIVGVLAALASTIDEPPKKLQQLPSVKKTEQFMANIPWKNIVGQALYLIITLLTINFKGESEVKDTMIFNIFVLWQLSTIFSTKGFEINIIKWMQREKLFWTIVGSVIVFQGVIVEALESFAGTKRLNWKQWAECIGVAVLAWPIGWLVKRINVQRCLSSAPAVSCTYI